MRPLVLIIVQGDTTISVVHGAGFRARLNRQDACRVRQRFNVAFQAESANVKVTQQGDAGHLLCGTAIHPPAREARRGVTALRTQVPLQHLANHHFGTLASQKGPTAVAWPPPGRGLPYSSRMVLTEGLISGGEACPEMRQPYPAFRGPVPRFKPAAKIVESVRPRGCDAQRYLSEGLAKPRVCELQVSE